MTGPSAAAPRGLTGAALVVAVVAFLAAAPGAWVRATYGAHTTADEPHYLLTAISLAEDGDLDVADELAAERWRTFHEAGLPQQAVPQEDGSVLVPHDPLLPALLVPGVLLGGWVGAKLSLALLGGALAALTLWVAVRRFGAGVGAATGTVALLGASLPLAPYGTQVYPEVPAALAVLVAVGAATAPTPRPRHTAVLVAAVVALPWLAVKYVPVAATIALLHLWRRWRAADQATVTGAAIAYAVAGVVYLALHVAWYGGATVYAAGDFFQEAGGQLTVVGARPDYLGRSRRLLGLLVDREFGVAAWQPLWLLAVPGVAALVRQRPDHWRELTLPLGVGWLVATFVALTMQGWWVPGRQVVAVLPLAAIVIARFLTPSVRRLAVGATLGALGVVSHLWLTVEGLRGRLTWVVDLATTSNPWYRLWARVLPDYLHVTAGTWLRHAAWLLVIAALAWWAWRAAADTSPRNTSAADLSAGA